MSARLMEDFLDLASDNTSKNLETCGVLGAFLESGTFYVTNLIIPKQESTSNSCQTVNEVKMKSPFSPQDGSIRILPRAASCLKLICTPNTPTRFPEAVGIVMAPTDTSRVLFLLLGVLLPLCEGMM
ncbi:AMSH-like ubiquitin thioesterase 2 isoform X2 [Henckelia pumila]|uniref:AMSH-like ubiquitin thioesterase 2 isoform X2 n=1 Tax=Henckelia pumila TaxID=405737 RepID=UPI003C6E25AC